MGGESSEREVSLVSGKEVMKNLNREKYEVWGIDVPGELSKLDEIKPDIAFIALHGKGGEDGIIQKYLENRGIKYTGCEVKASELGMNKKNFLEMMRDNGIKIPQQTKSIPCVVKPNSGGSSIGVSIVREKYELKNAVNKAKKYDREILIEEYIEGREITGGILGNDVLPIVEIIPKGDFFDYESKYNESGAEEICPAGLSEEMTKKVQEIVLKVFKIIGGKGFARVDMIIRKDIPYVLEINTIPGLTPNSLLPKEARAAGISYPAMLDRIIELAL